MCGYCEARLPGADAFGAAAPMVPDEFYESGDVADAIVRAQPSEATLGHAYASISGSGDRGASPLDALAWDYVAPKVIDVYLPREDHFVAERGPDLNERYRADALTNRERAAAEMAFADISAVADVTFNYVDDVADADFAIWSSGARLGGQGYWYVGGGGLRVDGTRHTLEGWAWLDNTDRGWSKDGLRKGGDGYGTLVHEILHGLGMAHPHDDGGGSEVMEGVRRAFGDYGDFDLNQAVFTMMSYNRGWDGPNGETGSRLFGGAAGPMALDIAYLQSVYGANETTAAGDDTYVLDPTDGRGGDGTWYEAIWDTGGTDRIVVGDKTKGVVIDLRPATVDYAAGGGGFVSAHEGVRGGVTIAAGVVIENARGSNADDLLTGNDAANRLDGRGGSDELRGGAGDDNLRGGRGSDLLDGGTGDDVLKGGGGADLFVFGGDWGADVIKGYRAGIDALEFGVESGVSALDDLTVETVGRHVLLSFGEDEILLRRAAATFDADDLLFA